MFGFLAPHLKMGTFRRGYYGIDYGHWTTVAHTEDDLSVSSVISQTSIVVMLTSLTPLEISVDKNTLMRLYQAVK